MERTEYDAWMNHPVTVEVTDEVSRRLEAARGNRSAHLKQGEYPQASYWEGIVAGLEDLQDIAQELIDDE
jgi:hypothetical protein